MAVIWPICPASQSLLDINDLALHTPADILAERYTQKVMDQLMEDKPGLHLPGRHRSVDDHPRISGRLRYAKT